MADDVPIGKIMLALGLFAAFAVLLYGAAGPSFPFTPAFPSLDNPFNSRLNTTLAPIADNTTQPPATVVNNVGPSISHCTNSTAPVMDWYGCLRYQDMAGSYATLNFSRQVFWVNVSGPVGGAGNLPVFDATVTIQCLSTATTPVPLTVTLQNPTQFYGFGNQPLGTPQPLGGDCPTGGWANVTLRIDFPTFYPTLSNFTGLALTISGASPYNISVSFARVDIEFGTVQECRYDGTLIGATAYIGCQILVGAQFVYNFGRLIINIIGYIFAWVGVVASLIGNGVSVLVWLFTVPGMPLPFQLVIDALIAGSFTIMVLGVTRIIRGSNQ
jgi:hypothetical protein